MSRSTVLADVWGLLFPFCSQFVGVNPCSEKSLGQRFVYHDGVFESLDPRKKQNLLAEIHKYTEMGIQSVITLIDSDSPEPSKEEDGAFTTGEIVLTLHDENMQGRLFRMKAW